MGSPLRLVFGGEATHPADADRHWQAVVDEFELAEAAMSRFRDMSELTALNRAASADDVAHPSVRLRRALTAADRAHRITGGRFDPRVLMDLDRLGYQGAALGGPDHSNPADEARSLAAGVVERVGRDGLTIARPIDLGGIGKGLTLRWAAALLGRRGARDFLLEAGGDLVAGGIDPDGVPWQLGVEDPTGGEDLAVIAVSDLAVATSSIGVHRWTVDGRVVHHLLDPRTGEPADGGLVAVTVVGPDPAWAEVWSKVLFLGGPDAIAGEARARGLAAWWVTDDGALEMTAAARAQTIWVAAEDG
jgi:Membrane-associated lipoprotein involved in thiamine biosynthesis